jgi:hypothetical protein
MNRSNEGIWSAVPWQFLSTSEELFPKAVDGGDSSSGLSFAVDDPAAVDQLL